MSNQSDPNIFEYEPYNGAGGLKARIELQEKYRTHPQPWLAWFFTHLKLDPPIRLLELGCGAGDLWLAQRPRRPSGGFFCLSDLSIQMARQARQGLAGLPSFVFGVWDTQALPFRDEQFDLVVGAGLLDLLPDLRQALGEIRRVLVPGGRFYTSAGGRSHLVELEGLVRPFFPQAEFGGAPDKFGLENAVDRLSAWFAQVELYPYPDELVFPEVEPLLRYILSEEATRARLSKDGLQKLQRSLEALLEQNGEMRVKVEKGLLVGRKPAQQEVRRESHGK